MQKVICMESNTIDRNQYQIIRKDARNCFVEVKSDSFPIGKMHLEFATYDISKPAGQRQTNHVHIYIDMGEYFNLAHYILHGSCHSRMMAIKKGSDENAYNLPLYQCLGGTSAERLALYGRSRKDGMSLSRSIKLYAGKKADYLLCAESGPGEANDKGLIVPRYGNKPEHRVSVSLSLAHLNELLLIPTEHYRAWLSYWYSQHYQAPQRANGNVSGSSYVSENGNSNADDTKMF